MGIESIVKVSVSVNDVQPARAGFGVPLVLAQHSVGAGGPLVRSYASLQEAVDDGHAAGSGVYAILAAMFSQRPRPPIIKVGRRTTLVTREVMLSPQITTEGYVYRFRVSGSLIEYTVLAGESQSSVTTAIAILIDALASVACVAVAFGGSKACRIRSASTGGFYTITELARDAFVMTDNSSAGSVAAELDAVVAEDPAFYGLVCDVMSAATISALVVPVETQRRVFVSDTHDTGVADFGVSTDIASTCFGLYARTYLQYHEDYGVFSAAALLSGRLTDSPGSDTWAHKTLRGIRACVLSTSQEGALQAKSCGSYTLIGGVGVTLWGASTEGEYMDITRGVDWLIARMCERIFSLLVRNKKIPYTDDGIDLIENEVDAQLKQASEPPYNLITGDYEVKVPKAKDVSSADKATRLLDRAEFSATLQGAIHATVVSGSLTP